jgi:hypothetical protein
MPANAKLIIEADVSSVLRGDRQIQESQKLTEKGFVKTAQTGISASEKTAAAIKKEAQAYELLEQAERQAVRARGSTTAARGPMVTPYGLAPTVSRSVAAASIAGFRGGDLYEFSDDVAQRDAAHTVQVRRRWARERAVRMGHERRAFAMAAEEEQQRGVFAKLAGEQARGERFRGFFRNGIGSIAQAAIGLGAAYVGANMLTEQDELKKHYGETLIESDRMLAPLMGVGENSSNRGQVRSEVFKMSGGMGIEAGQIAAGRFAIESGASNLDPSVRDQMLRNAAQFNKMQGTDIGVAGKALNKYVQIFGSELEAGAKGVKQASNKIAYAAEVGDFEIEDAAKYMPRIFGSFKAMGFHSDDALAGLITASQKGGDMRVTATGLSDIALHAHEAESKIGKKLSTDFPTMLKQIADWKGPEMLEVFGTEAIATAQNLSDSADAIRQYREELKGLSGDVDTVAEKLSMSWADSSHATSEILQSLREDARNREANKAGNPAIAPSLTYSGLVDKAVEDNAGELTPGAVKWGRKFLATYTPFMGDEKAGALADTIKKMRDAGNNYGADYLTLQQGEISGHTRRKTESMATGFLGLWNQTKPRDRYTGQQEADAFAEMRKTHDWSLKDDDTYWTYMNNGQRKKGLQYAFDRRNNATVVSEGVNATRSLFGPQLDAAGRWLMGAGQGMERLKHDLPLASNGMTPEGGDAGESTLRAAAALLADAARNFGKYVPPDRTAQR